MHNQRASHRTEQLTLVALVRAQARQILSPFPICTGGGGTGLGREVMITSRGCSAEPEMASMKIQDLGESWLQPSINQSCLLCPPEQTKLSLIFSALGNPIACMDLPHAPVSGARGIPHISQMTRFPPFSVFRHSQVFTDVLPQKTSEKSEALGPSSALLCDL